MFKASKNFPVPGVYEVSIHGYGFAPSDRLRRFVSEDGCIRHYKNCELDSRWTVQNENGVYFNCKFISALDGTPPVGETFPIAGEYECFVVCSTERRFVHANGKIYDNYGEEVGEINVLNPTTYKNVRYIGPPPQKVQAAPAPKPAKEVKHPRFWLVWCPEGQYPPSYRHDTEHSAEVEAERMAKEHPHKRFYVIEAKSFCLHNEFKWTVLNQAPQYVPF